MAYEPHLIAPFTDSGLQKYYKPWIIGKEAFPDLQDAYAWRGNVRKREGTKLFASLPASDKPVMGLKNWVNPVSFAESLIAFSQTKAYLYNNGTGIFNDITFRPDTSAFSFTGLADDFFWASNYAGSMWVSNNVDNINYYNGTNNNWSAFIPTVNGTTQMTKALIVLPYKGRLVVLNTLEGGNSFPSRARWSQIGTPYTSNVVAATVTAVTPTALANGTTTDITVTDASGFVIGENAGVLGMIGTIGPKLNFNQYNVSNIAGLVITIDVNTFGLIWTSGGTLQGPGAAAINEPPPPFTIDIFGWRDDIPGRGGYNDADTSERIVSAEIVRDTLIVFFQRSTWRLRYTGNEILPFIWERLNTQYGAEATHSHIAFDDAALAFSRFGWIGADTNSAARIDEAIPDDSFSIETNDASLTGMKRICGIRDFYRQFAYWNYQSIGNTTTNQIYAYNYIDKTWSIFNPSIPIQTFGYYRANGDITWSTLNEVSPDADSWENYNNSNDIWSAFSSGQNENFPFIVGGDADGNVYQMFEFFSAPVDDNGTNYGFTIQTKSFNPYINEGHKCRLGYVDLYCTTNNGGAITVQHYIDDQTSPIFTRTVELYARGVLNISSITTGATTTVVTVTNHNLQNNQNVTFSGIVGTVGNIMNNQIFIATVVDAVTFTINLITTGFVYSSNGQIWNPAIPQGNARYTRIYLGAIAHFHQLVFTMTQEQIDDPVMGSTQFEMQGLVLWTRKQGLIRG